MGTKITTLKAKTSGDDVYPNILAQNIPSSAVDGTKIANNTITTGKLQDGAVTGSKIANGTITGNKLAEGVALSLHTEALSTLISDAHAATPAGIRDLIVDFLSYDAGYIAPRFVYTKSTGLITEIIFWIVDGVNYLAYAPINDMASAIVLDSAAKVLTFASSVAPDIEVQWLA